MNRRLRDRLVALFAGVALLAPISAQAAGAPKAKIVAGKKLVSAKTADPHPHNHERGRLGKSLATRLSDRPKTKIGRFVSVLGKIGGAIINAKQFKTPEGTLGAVPGGKAYQDGVSMNDVDQGHLADCNFVGALASVAYTHAELLEKAITEQPDGTMSIRLYHRTANGFEADDIRLDKLVPLTASGRPAFARGATATQMWPAWMQKAYAAERSEMEGKPFSYETINHGGLPSDALEALTGKRARTIAVSPGLGTSLFTTLKQAVASKNPITALTPKKLPEGALVHEWHTYSVLDTSEHDGQQWVKVRNPWGYSEPGDPSGGDGIFEISLTDFAKSFNSISIGG